VYFEVEISVPANTAEKDAQETDLELHVGMLTRVEVFTRPGQKETLRLRILDELTIVAPSRRPGFFSGNGETHVWTGRYQLKKREKQLQVQAWNTSTSKVHGCKIGLTVQEPDEYDPWSTVRDLVTIFKRMLGVD